MEFIKYITLLEDLISGVSHIYTPRSKENFEFLICDTYYNKEREYIGKFYNLREDLTIWVGYYKKLGFCVSFYMTNEEELKENLYYNGYRHFYTEFCPKDKGNWYSIKLHARNCIIKRFRHTLVQCAEKIINSILESI